MASVLQMKLLLSPTSSINLTRTMANLTAIELTYEKFGNPTEVIQMKERKVPELGKDDVMVRMLVAPINPSDINTIQGI